MIATNISTILVVTGALIVLVGIGLIVPHLAGVIDAAERYASISAHDLC